MLSCLRSQGLAARYVSGYLLTQPPPGQPRMIGADASHAWVSVSYTHLDVYKRQVQDSLAYWAPRTGEAPLIVLLTPGPYNETYFEHAYLARYLGFPLVEGQDLTVRSECVYLRTLSGLRRVHAILRRLDDDYCDPLELRGDSALGVPGLLQAVRAGNVLVANALGSGLLESPALPGFLPGACEKLLGEPLAMPSVATWWCGEQAALEFTIEHLDELVIKASYPSQRFDPLFGNELTGSKRKEMIARLRARPQAYVCLLYTSRGV